MSTSQGDLEWARPKCSLVVTLPTSEHALERAGWLSPGYTCFPCLSPQQPPEESRGQQRAGSRLLTTRSSWCMWRGCCVASSSSLHSGSGGHASLTQPPGRARPMAGSPGCNEEGLQTWGGGAGLAGRAVTGSPERGGGRSTLFPKPRGLQPPRALPSVSASGQSME